MAHEWLSFSIAADADDEHGGVVEAAGQWCKRCGCIGTSGVQSLPHYMTASTTVPKGAYLAWDVEPPCTPEAP